MSKLDDILEITTFTDWENDVDTDGLKQQIKDLMLGLIGEDETRWQGDADNDLRHKHKNELRAELRQKVRAL